MMITFTTQTCPGLLLVCMRPDSGHDSGCIECSPEALLAGANGLVTPLIWTYALQKPCNIGGTAKSVASCSRYCFEKDCRTPCIYLHRLHAYAMQAALSPYACNQAACTDKPCTWFLPRLPRSVNSPTHTSTEHCCMLSKAAKGMPVQPRPPCNRLACAGISLMTGRHTAA